MTIWQRIFALFERPRSFNRDAYGYITNQLGHFVLGGVAPTFALWLWGFLAGAHPLQWPITFLCLSVYFIWWELGWQGWRGRDTIEDTVFFALGSLPFYVLEMGDEILLAERHSLFIGWRTLDILAALFLILSALLVPGVTRRIRRKNEP